LRLGSRGGPPSRQRIGAMTESTLAELRRLLVDDYHDLKKRLARRFGSADFAGEVLHEAWLRLDRSDASALSAAVHNPKAYLYRVALNVANDQKRAEKRWLGKVDVDALCREAQNELDPGRIAEARSELGHLANAINALPPRRRAVFIAARLEHLPYKAIAARLGITVRVVERELRIALETLSAAIEAKTLPSRPRQETPAQKKSTDAGGSGAQGPSKT
jgi:RNA polymerase sigma-70 factor (ECF subfamily)